MNEFYKYLTDEAKEAEAYIEYADNLDLFDDVSDYINTLRTTGVITEEDGKN